jgi:hypothetical protein
MRPRRLIPALALACLVASSWHPATTFAANPPGLAETAAAAARVGESAAEAGAARPERTPTVAAAMKGGADPSEGGDGTRAGTERGLGSSAIGRRDGGVEDGRRVQTADGAALAGTLATVAGPPAPAPPLIAAAAPKTSPAPTRRAAPLAAGSPEAAGLRESHPRRGVPLPVPGAPRSLLPSPRRDLTALRPAPRVADAQTSPPAGATAITGWASASVSPPPVAAAYGLLAAALAAAALFFSALVAPAARGRPVPFISQLERPG